MLGTPAGDVAAAHGHVAHVPANVALWPRLTGVELLDLLARIGPGTDLAHRAELVERFALDPSRPARTYSSGNQQKVALVAAFASHAPVLVLDEPISGLDPLMEQQFRLAVAQGRDRGRTFFLSSHQLAEVEAVCDRVAILRAGRLVDTADVADLRALHRTEVVAVVRGPLPELAGVDGVSDVEAYGDRLRIALTGPPGLALRGSRRLRRAAHARAHARGDLPRLLRVYSVMSRRGSFGISICSCGVLKVRRPEADAGVHHTSLANQPETLSSVRNSRRGDVAVTVSV